MKSWRLLGRLGRCSGQPSVAHSVPTHRALATAGTDVSLQPSTSVPSLPITLRELQSSLHPPASAPVSHLDAQLYHGEADAAARNADLDDQLCRYVTRASQPTPGQLFTIQLLRRYNGAMPGLKGQTILAKVISINDQRVLVDTGFHGLSELPRADVTISHIHTPDGAPPARLTSDDVRAGDVLRLRLDATYTPYGDMQLTAVQDDADNRRRLVWDELHRCMQAGEPITGRILNECRGGFAVGVAGFVAKLPADAAASDTAQRIGVRQSFLIAAMDRARQLITLRDPMMLRGGRRLQAEGGGRRV